MLDGLKAQFTLPETDRESVRAWLHAGPPPRQILRWLDSSEYRGKAEILNEVRSESLDVPVVQRIGQDPAMGSRLASNPNLSESLSRALEGALFGHIARCFQRLDPDMPSDEPSHPDTIEAAAGLSQLYLGGLRPSLRIRRELLDMVGYGLFEYTAHGTVQVIDHPAREAAFTALNSIDNLGRRELSKLAASAKHDADRLASLVNNPSADLDFLTFLIEYSYERPVHERIAQIAEAREHPPIRKVLKRSTHVRVQEVMIQVTEGEERRGIFQEAVKWHMADALEMVEKDRWGLRADIEPADLEPILNSSNKKYRLRAIQAVSLLKQEAKMEAAEMDGEDPAVDAERKPPATR